MPPSTNRRSSRIQERIKQESSSKDGLKRQVDVEQEDDQSKPNKKVKLNNDDDDDRNRDLEQLTGSFRHVKMSSFPYSLPYKRLNLRKHPHLYRPGKGEQGVLMVEPYKSEILPNWKFKDPETATNSSQKLKIQFDSYIKEQDFIGADMTRKFIQMGFTRARRYANHKGGRKYSITPEGKRGEQLPRTKEDPVKAESAQIFKDVLEQVKVDQKYIDLRKAFEKKYENVKIPIFQDEKDPIK